MMLEVYTKGLISRLATERLLALRDSLMKTMENNKYGRRQAGKVLKRVVKELWYREDLALQRYKKNGGHSDLLGG